MRKTIVESALARGVALAWLGAATVALPLGGCDVAKFTADSTAGLFERAAPAFEEYWDYRLAGEAVPATIIQLEGVVRVAPENEVLLAQLAQAYFGYAFGWIETDVEALEFEGNYAQAEVERQRAQTMYLRSKDLSMYRLSLSHPEAYDEVRKPITELKAWLERTFTEKEQAQVLLWVGQAWAAYVATSLDDMEAVADLPYAKAFVERSIELDRSYFYASGLTFMGIAAAVEPAGNLDTAKGYFDQALDLTERRALLVQVAMARFYATKRGDRELFDALLGEVLDAGDVLPEARLGNRIARERAALYTDHVDQIF